MKKILAVVALVCLFLNSCSDSEVNTKAANQKGLGSSAHDLLSEDKFDSMIIEVVYVEGFEPSATALNNFKNFLENRINKSGGIKIQKELFLRQEMKAIQMLKLLP